ncbi:MAG TPA: PEP/pyruvate-binding domain-containing protein, partial [Tepidisphaeraceae bacterium]|nr:PEP/pyruvate-binding domain-containing protein [Tepidisphaeraceae bacterium]
MAKKATKAVKKAAKSGSGKQVKRVYFFGAGKAEGKADQKLLLGGKGANLADMTLAGLPVPPGFTITTETCADYNTLGGKFPNGLLDEVKQHLARTEKASGKKFGDPKNPLLLAVRSGAAVSMPGMMDTVLNIGLNDVVVEGLAQLTNNARFAYDCYRRLINMFGDTVMGVPHEEFEHALTEVKKSVGVTADTDLRTADLKLVVEKYKEIYK